ncbi:MAG: leucine-rich repeat protein [Clostridia bacterium]|nr:leucine-rich repeat protein [Clostridia bacterium]
MSTKKIVSLQEKIQKIEAASSLEELLPMYRPKVNGDTYYFVSYSHKDFREVYKDILLFQEEGISVWYDGGIIPGKSWAEVADLMMTRYSCKGIIFYLSRNSLNSSAVIDEINFAKNSGKDFVPIFLGIKDTNEFKTVIAGTPHSQKQKEFLLSVFNENVIFIPYESNLEVKLLQIKKIKSTPLFEYDPQYRMRNAYMDHPGYAISNIKDRYIKSVTIPQFVYNVQTNKKDEIIAIGTTAFSACQMLERVILPFSIAYIGEYAFANCKKLRSIALPNVRALGDGSFWGCSDLEEIYCPEIEQGYIGTSVFENCTNLRIATFCNTNSLGRAILFHNVPFGAFRNCHHLISVDYCWSSVDGYAFENCFHLNEISIYPQYIGYSAFKNCKSLKKVSLCTQLERIDGYAFYNCMSLQNIIFEGTVAEWAAIPKGIDWAYNVPATKVICCNGESPLN